MTKKHWDKVKVLVPLMRAEVQELQFKESMRKTQKEVAALLREERLKSGMTAAQVAKQMGCSECFISHTERGMRKITIAFADRFMEIVQQ